MEKRDLKEKLKSKTKKINLIIIAIVFAIIIFLSPKIVSTARYIYKALHENILASKDFYFSSDKLSLNHTEYQVTNNWSGAETYRVTVNMSSKQNDMAYTESDIQYSVTYTCSSNITCSLSKSTGTIVGTENHGVNEDAFTIDITPAGGTALNNTEVAWVEIVATSTSPYRQELSGRLVFEVGSSDIYYEIVDSENSPYLTVNIVNSSASAEDVTLSYNPTQVLLDMTGHYYLDSTANTTQTMPNTYNYLNSITSNVNSLSTTSVKFYKVDPTQNYTHLASDSTTPIITLSY